MDAYDPELGFARQRRLELLNGIDLEEMEGLADAWLGSRFSLSYLPSLGVLAEPRAIAPSDERKAFLGIGNPTCLPGGTFHPLPESELLLDGLASFFGANPESDVVVRDEATVSRVLELDRGGNLKNRRVLCFATHAVYPERRGDTLQQSALVLGGPKGPEYLTELDISQLTLRADLVLLTACYTGSPSGKAITTPLSGLAQAFFTAGARALLVSSWPVDVGATEMLIREMFSAALPGETLSQALQRASASVRESRAHPHFAHPLFWAGFSVVGDGRASILPGRL